MQLAAQRRHAVAEPQETSDRSIDGQRPAGAFNEDSRLPRQWSRRPKTAHALALRSRIVLACAGDKGNQATATRKDANRAAFAHGSQITI
jgi:hypothetical protein